MAASVVIHSRRERNLVVEEGFEDRLVQEELTAHRPIGSNLNCSLSTGRRITRRLPVRKADGILGGSNVRPYPASKEFVIVNMNPAEAGFEARAASLLRAWTDAFG